MDVVSKELHVGVLDIFPCPRPTTNCLRCLCTPETREIAKWLDKEFFTVATAISV